MREHGVPFKGELVRAILAGTKVQTRRPVTARNTYLDGGTMPRAAWAQLRLERAWVDPGPSPAGNEGPYLQTPWPREDDETVHRLYPHVQRGDRLWVRETFAKVNSSEGPSLLYRANGALRSWREWSETFGPDYGAGPSMDYDAYPGDYCMWWSDLLAGEPGHAWSPSIHMPRWASRLTLEVTRVRVQRVQEITVDDARAEGMTTSTLRGRPLKITGPGDAEPREGVMTSSAPDYAFAVLWEDVYGPRGLGWRANPWVWAFDFRRVEVEGG